MAAWVPDMTGCVYQWAPAFGGFRKPNPDSHNIALRHPSFRSYADYMETAEFVNALATLLAQLDGRHVAIMCSETVWWRCHRRLIADAATLLHGVNVQHLMHDGKLRPHIPTACSRVNDDGQLRYDVLLEDLDDASKD